MRWGSVRRQGMSAGIVAELSESRRAAGRATALPEGYRTGRSRRFKQLAAGREKGKRNEKIDGKVRSRRGKTQRRHWPRNLFNFL